MRRPRKNTKEYKKVKKELQELYVKADILLKELKTTSFKKEITNKLDHIFFEARNLEQKLIKHLRSRNIPIKHTL